MNSKTTILFLAANPMDTSRLRVDEEMRSIDEAIERSKLRDKFDLKYHSAVRISDLQRLLLRYEPDIVHFSGHGSESGEIVLEDENGNSASVRPESLSQVFSLFKDKVKCVVLNACFSALQAVAIKQHIDTVVGMPAQHSDKTAIKFASSFYQALGFGKNVESAYWMGLAEIDLNSLSQENKPQLLSDKNTSDSIQKSIPPLLVTIEWSRYPPIDLRYAVLFNLKQSKPFSFPVNVNIACVSHLLSTELAQHRIEEIFSLSPYISNSKVITSAATDNLSPVINGAIQSLLNPNDGRHVVRRIILLIDSEVLDEDEVLLQVDMARDLGIRITVIGIGVDWNVEFADEIANISGGTSGFCETVEHLFRELSMLFSSFISPFFIGNAKLIVKFEPDIVIEHICNVIPRIAKCSFYQLGIYYVIPFDISILEGSTIFLSLKQAMRDTNRPCKSYRCDV